MKITLAKFSRAWTSRIYRNGHLWPTGVNKDRKFIPHSADGLLLKEKRAIPTSKKRAAHANVFLNVWISPYSLLNNLLIDNVPQFVSTLFATLWEFLDLIHVTTAACHLFDEWAS